MHRVLKPSNNHSRIILEELEPRRLFSGGIEGLVPSGPEYLTGPIFRDLDAHKSQNPAGNEASTQIEHPSREIVFIDASVENFQQFVDDVRNNTDANRIIEVVVLDRDRDGIEQISSYLQQQNDVDAIHIISHGSDGNVQLGDITLNADSLQQNSTQIALWANAFTDSGDMLFYGCDLASSGIGKHLINELGALTMTDVAASDDLTGADNQGGDWLLEYKAGKIESSVAVSTDLQQQYRATLPTATPVDDNYNVDEDSVLNEPAPGVLANDIDAVNVTRVNSTAPNVPNVGTEITLGSGALLTLNADGSFIYDTNGAFETLGAGASTTESFTYEAKGSSGPDTIATVTITIDGVDDPATISGDISFNGNEGDIAIGIMGATDIEGLTDGTVFSVTTPATNGLATIHPASGSWSFTPTDPNWIGTDQFTVTVTDDLGGTTTQLISVTLVNVDDDPAAIGGDIGYIGDEGDVVAGTMTASDPEGVADGTVFSITTPASNGIAAIDPASGAWTFTLTDINWFGSDSFTVTVTDDLGGTLAQIVNITLASINDAPVATDDAVGTTENEILNSSVPVATDVDGTVDPNGYLLGGTNVAEGSLVFNADGSYSFDPGTDFDDLAVTATRNVTFTYTATDNDGALSAEQIITIVVTGTNDAPVITDGPDIVGLDETNAGLSANGDLSIGDVDVRDVVTASVDSLVISGTSNRSDAAAPSDAALLAMFSINPTAILDSTENIDTLAWDFNSAAEAFDYLATGETLILQYTVRATDDDGTPLSDTETVTITITGSNDAPVAVEAGVGTTENTVLNSNVPAASDVDGTIANYTLGGTNVAEGALLFNADGSYSFDPGPDFDDLAPGVTRDVTFTYTAIDNNGATSGEQTVVITVTGTNDLPVIGGVTTGTAFEDVDVVNGMIRASGTLTISDADTGHSSFIAQSINSSNGVLTIDTAGNWNYRADNNSSAIQSLHTGETLVETVTVTTFDGTPHDIVIRINGSEEPEPPTVTTVDPDPEPTEEEPPATELTEPPESVINEEVETALEEFDAEEIYTTPQPREPLPATTGDPDGISQFTDAEPQNNPYARVNGFQAEPVVAQKAEVREINIDNLSFEASDDPALAERYEMALMERIELMRLGMDGDASARNGDNVEVQIFVGATTSLTAGIVSWVLRGGSLLASLMSTVPLLNRFDPFPILKSRNDEEDVEPDDDTETTGPVGENHKRVDNMFNGKQSAQSRSEYLDE
jgi:VCBS repeat-containing protein